MSVCVSMCKSVIMRSHSEAFRAAGCFLISLGAQRNISPAHVHSLTHLHTVLSHCALACSCEGLSLLLSFTSSQLSSVECQ